MSAVVETDDNARVAEMIDKLIDMLRKKTGKEDADWSSATTLEDAGLDSFDVVECIFQLEEEMGVSIDFNANNESKVSTIGEFAEVIVRNMTNEAIPGVKAAGAAS
jgi:acyl carrier protein